MILECPSCQNRYLVDPRALGAKGRMVRCAKCKYEWYADPPKQQPDADVLGAEQAAALQQEVPPIPEGSSVPAVMQASRTSAGWKWGLAGSALFCSLCAAVYFHAPLLRAVPMLEPAYAALGIYNTEGVVLAGLEYQRAPSENGLRDQHTFTGSLVNTATEPRRIPRMVITLLGKEGIKLRRQPVVSDAILAPGESQALDIPLTTSPESLRHVIIELGNPLELKLR